MKSLLFAGLLLRIGFLIYGHFQDQHPVIKFTDVDYTVFTDAAEFVLSGLSPYKRATYRYTPLLAWIMVPNHYNILFGKILFSLCDLIAGVLIYKILLQRNIKQYWGLTALWILNPFVAGISTRGNAESILALLILSTLYFIEKGHLKTSAIIFGLSVHFKIYPIIYAVPIWFGLDTPFKYSLFSKKRIMFGLIAATTFIVLNMLMYIL
jgi:phosphatidylinositol glycan class M